MLPVLTSLQDIRIVGEVPLVSSIQIKKAVVGIVLPFCDNVVGIKKLDLF
jgi:hypothetical protein